MNAWRGTQTWAGVAVALAAAALAGCAASGPQGEQAAKAPRPGTIEALVQQHEDKASGLKTLSFAPLEMDCERRSNCPTLGVHWASAAPNRAQLLIGVAQPSAATQVNAIEFQLRGFAPQRVRALAKTQAALPQGVTAFAVPMETLERIAVTKGAWVRVHVSTPEGAKVLEENMLTGEHRSRAQEALQRLVGEAYRGTDKEMSTGLLNLFAQPEKRD